MAMINTISEFLNKEGKTAYQLIKETGISETTGYKLARDPNHLPSIKVLTILCDRYNKQPNAFIRKV